MVFAASHPGRDAASLEDRSARLAKANADLQDGLAGPPDGLDRQIAGCAVIGLAILSADGAVGYVNPAFRDMLGLADAPLSAVAEFLTRHAGDLLEDARGQVATAAAGPMAVERLWPCRGGAAFWGRATLGPLPPAFGAALLLQLENVDDRHRAEDASKAMAQRLEYALESAGQGAWDSDINTGKVFYSRTWRTMRGFRANEEIDSSVDAWLARVHPDDHEVIRANLDRLDVGETDRNAFEYREMHRDGSWRWFLSRGRTVAWNRDGTPARMVGTDTDITEMKREEARRAQALADTHRRNMEELRKAQRAAEAAQQVASSLARHDPVTGLPNRRRFAEVLNTALSSTLSERRARAILLLDLDRFKPINDVHGHDAGDAVLREIARRLSKSIRRSDSDTVARLGGDEFAIVFTGVDDGSALDEGVGQLAERLISTIEQPIEFDGGRIAVSASVGIVRCPEDGIRADDLLRRADVAMYAAKDAGRGTFRFFEPAMEAELRTRAALEGDFRAALAAGSVRPKYQPIVRLDDGGIIGFEILARWRDPERGDVPPTIFVMVAERLHLVVDMTYQLLRRGCLDVRDWPTAPSLGINVSPVHFTDPDMPQAFFDILDETRFPPNRLAVEVTEDVLMRDVEVAKRAVCILQERGVRVCLDDFGTGYANFSQLRDFGFDTLKIDRSFVTDVATGKERVQLVRSILELTSNLNLRAIAEGIETEESLRYMIELGATHGQGFLFGAAMSADEARKMLVDGDGRVPGRAGPNAGPVSISPIG